MSESSAKGAEGRGERESEREREREDNKERAVHAACLRCKSLASFQDDCASGGAKKRERGNGMRSPSLLLPRKREIDYSNREGSNFLLLGSFERERERERERDREKERERERGS